MPDSPFHPPTYGPVFAGLISKGAMPTQVPRGGNADRTDLPALSALTLESAFAHARIVDQDMARCCLAAVWLLHDELDASHQISQAIDAPTGSFWHGIMHRCEGDFANSKYWFARIGRHEAVPLIGARIRDLGRELNATSLAERIAPAGLHHPSALTDACQAALRTSADDAQRAFCQRVQQAEWEALFDYCYRQAVGS